MSDTASVVAALESALAAMTPAMVTAWEGKSFNPATQASGVPYQRPFTIFARPNNDEYGPGFNDRGFFQVNLHFPSDQGANPARLRLDLLRATFPRGAAFSKNGVVVKIMKTPAPLPPTDDLEGRYVLPVSIEFETSLQT